jgi:hypothetical protein
MKNGTRLTDTTLKPVLTKCNIRELNDVLRNLTEQQIAAIHVQTGVEYPTINIFTLPAGLPMDVKSRFPIVVEQGYTAIRGYFTANKMVVITTDAKFNFGKVEETVLNLLVGALHQVKNAKTGMVTQRLHMVADLEYTFTKVHGENGYQWIRMDGTKETNVRVLDYNPQKETFYGFRRRNGNFTEFVQFQLTTKNKIVTNLAYGQHWDNVVNAPVQTQFVEGSKVKHDQLGNLKVDLTFDDNITRGLTVTKAGLIEWTQEVEYSVIGRYFTGDKFGIIIRETNGFALIPPDIAANLPVIGQRYQIATTNQPRVTTDHNVL